MDVYNEELLQDIKPESVLSWVRARLSNQLASSGEEWAEVFSMYHSGTCEIDVMSSEYLDFLCVQYAHACSIYVYLHVLYIHILDANQWMVLDLSRFRPGLDSSPGAGLLTVIEEIPG